MSFIIFLRCCRYLLAYSYVWWIKKLSPYNLLVCLFIQSVTDILYIVFYAASWEFRICCMSQFRTGQMSFSTAGFYALWSICKCTVHTFVSVIYCQCTLGQQRVWISQITQSEHIDSMLGIRKDTFKHADGADTAEVALNAHFKNMFKGNIFIKTSQIHGIDSARQGFCWERHVLCESQEWPAL